MERSSLATVRVPTRMPDSRSCRASFAVVRRVHLRAPPGSPAVSPVPQIADSVEDGRRFFSSRFRPPPGLRIRPLPVSPARSS